MDEPDLVAEVCLMFRNQALIPSGGWMGSLVLLCAERLGLWDVTTFFTLFLFMWIIIRSTYVEVATIVAFYFDFVIPLQYANNEQSAMKHKKHLEDYWPKFIIGLVLEAAAYFLLSSDDFTRMACVKTMITTGLWFSKQHNGKPVEWTLGGDNRAVRERANRIQIVQENAEDPGFAQGLAPPFPTQEQQGGASQAGTARQKEMPRAIWETVLPNGLDTLVWGLKTKINSDDSFTDNNIIGQMVLDLMTTEHRVSAEAMLKGWNDALEESNGELPANLTSKYDEFDFCGNEKWVGRLDEYVKRAKQCGMRPFVIRGMVRDLMSHESFSVPWKKCMEDLVESGHPNRKAINRPLKNFWSRQSLFRGDEWGERGYGEGCDAVTGGPANTGVRHVPSVERIEVVPVYGPSKGVGEITPSTGLQPIEMKWEERGRKRIMRKLYEEEEGNDGDSVGAAP